MAYNCQEPAKIVKHAIAEVLGAVHKRRRSQERGRFVQCGHFSDKGEGVNSSRFCTDVFYGRPLTFKMGS